MAFLERDPARVLPTEGHLLVHIDEVLGGTTAGGIFIPADVADAGGKKDTASGIVLRRGRLPALEHVSPGSSGHVRPGRTRKNQTGAAWPDEVFPVREGDKVFFPRTCPSCSSGMTKGMA